MKPIWTSSVC